MKKSSKAVLLAVAGALLLILAARHFWAVLQLFLDPATYVPVLTDKGGAASSLLGNFVGGVFTLLAGGFAIILYFIQERQAHVGRLVEWMSDLAKRFHEDAEFKEVRIKLAADREYVRTQLYLATALDAEHAVQIKLGSFQKFYARQTEFAATKGKIQWEFQRQLTDYIYFFEQVLAYGEMMLQAAPPRVAAALVDHFGWFLRSMFHCCEPDNAEADEALEERYFFILYLALNRYRRMAEVGLFLLTNEQSGEDRRFEALAGQVCGILREQRGDLAPRDHHAIKKRWASLLYSPSPTPR
jgi:hypothetical protein